MSSVALGTTVFKRTKKLANLLESIEGEMIDKVYIGDVGEIDEDRKKVYNKEYPFEIKVLDLPHDSGLGHSRNRISSVLKEEYILIVDNDVELPNNINKLKYLLDEHPNMGGVGGILIEDDNIRSGCYDLFENGDYIIKNIKDTKEIERVGKTPLVKFDMIQNVAMYKKECLEDHTWDSKYVISKEHLDFFVGHMKNTHWEFGVCPEVLFWHYPGGDDDYNSHRRSENKMKESERYFLNKWGYKGVIRGSVLWMDSYDPNESLFKLGLNSLLQINSKTPSPIQIRVLILVTKLKTIIYNKYRGLIK